MKRGEKENPGHSAPGSGGTSDSVPTMKSAPNGPGSDSAPGSRHDSRSALRGLRIEDLQDPGTAEEALASWDELEPSLLTAIERHPQHGPRLEMLRRADAWLRRGEGPGEGCPSAEELYDYGRGPGYGPLPSARRAAIEGHLAACSACEGLVETLATPPPAPLDSPEVRTARPRIPTPSRSTAPRPSPILAEPAESWRDESFERPLERSFDAEDARPRPRLRALPRLVPLAVAAALVLALGIWIAILPSDRTDLVFPKTPLLRGSSGGPLYFPRDRVLRPGERAAELFPILKGEIAFEIEPQEGASGYQIELLRHDGDAFAADGEVLTRLQSDGPTVRARLDLPPGSYTWTARAVVRGLALELGSRDFEVVADPVLDGALAALEGSIEPERSLKAVALLHEFGDESAARAIARSMPASPERDAYLGQVPGR